MRLLLFLILSLSGCQKLAERQQISKGEGLARRYCTSCHILPSPSDLPRHGWDQILPKMGARLGMQNTDAELRHVISINPYGLFPKEAQITREEWADLQLYFQSQAPEALEVEVTQIMGTSDIFEETYFFDDAAPATSIVRLAKDNQIWYGNAVTNQVHLRDLEKDTILLSLDVGGSPSQVHPGTTSLQVLSMGNIHPNDRNEGKLITYRQNVADTLLKSLSRPVHLSIADLNSDGQEDVVISEFGHFTGKLALYKRDSEGYEEQTLIPLPGSIKTQILDLNGDGHLDILALMAQGDEAFYLFTGNGKGSFQGKRLLSFPPSYGSTYFELYDFNQDGLLDILYLNGDNGDYSRPIMKPYHGLRIYLQEIEGEKMKFTEKYFFHFNGGFKAMVEDYDLDGDPDIACISYFPNSRTPEEGFLYLENQGQLRFMPKTIPASVNGKWLVADRKDIDNDGDIDIVLGNSLIMDQSGRFTQNGKNSTFVLLRNRTR